MEERITKEELLERLFHDDYENLKGRRLRLTRVRVPGKELSFAHVFTPNDRSIYENLALHIGVHEGEDHRGDAIGMVRVSSCGSRIYGSFLRDADPDRRFYGSDDSRGGSGTIFP